MVQDQPTHPLSPAVSPLWLQFWAQFELDLRHGPLLGLLNSEVSKKPNRLIVITANGFLWIPQLDPPRPPAAIVFDDTLPGFRLNDQPISASESGNFCTKLLDALSENRVAWFRFGPKKNATLDRNLYWDKIATHIGARLGIQVPCEIGNTGLAQHRVANALLDGLTKLKDHAHILTDDTLTPAPTWDQLITGYSVLDAVDATQLIHAIFEPSTLQSLDDATLIIKSQKIPIEPLYDLYCERLEPNPLKRWAALIEARFLGLIRPNSDGERVMYWENINLTFLEFCTEMDISVSRLIAALSTDRFEELESRIAAIPYRWFDFSAESTRSDFFSTLETLDRHVGKCLAFAEWNSELFADLRAVKLSLNRSADTLRLILRHCQLVNTQITSTSAQIEATRSKHQFTLHLISERLDHLRSTEQMEKVGQLIHQLDMTTRRAAI